jgi:hypothetical protein
MVVAVLSRPTLPDTDASLDLILDVDSRRREDLD